MKRCQRGDAGVGMVVVMVIMMVGLFSWAGPYGGGSSHMGGRQHAVQVEKTPLELLDESYARGEISREEYLQRRSDLIQR